VLCPKCINITSQGVERHFHADCFTVTAADRPLEPAAVPRWYKAGAYCTPLRFLSGDVARSVIVIDIVKTFCARSRSRLPSQNSHLMYPSSEQQQLQCGNLGGQFQLDRVHSIFLAINEVYYRVLHPTKNHGVWNGSTTVRECLETSLQRPATRRNSRLCASCMQKDTWEDSEAS
jgi:hypothetical protein